MAVNRPRAVVVASSPVSRAGVTAVLAEAGWDGVRQAASFEALEGWPPEERPGLAVAAPGSLEEVEALLEYAEGGAEAGIVVLGPVPEEERLAEALEGRVWGYLPLHTSGAALVAALDAVSNGLTVIDPALGLGLRPDGRREALGAGDDELTTREREVLQLIGLGLPNKGIAHRLGISEHTAKFHVASVLGKLGAATRAEAVRIGASRGLLAL